MEEQINAKAFKKTKKDKSAGRPIELTEELIKKVQNNLRAGAYIETAVVVAGISKATFYDWMKIANGKYKVKENEKPPSKALTELCKQFLDAVERAIEEATMRDLMVVDKAATGQDWEYERYKEDTEDPQTGRMHKKGTIVLNARGNPIPIKIGHGADWAAAAWKLERRKPKEW